MRILIIEDQETKYRAIEHVLVTKFGANVQWIRSVANSLGSLNQNWDAIILDMNFPAVGGAGRDLGRQETSGVKVLQVMVSQNIGTPVIIATAHDSFAYNRALRITSIEDLRSKMRKAFPAIFKGAVKVDYASDDWHDELIGLVESVRS